MIATSSRVLQGRYQVLDARGRGGMGRVYRAENLMLGRPCAVKEMLAPGAPDEAERARLAEAFRAEARILASLDHPSLPRVHDFFEESGRFYLVMDYIDGETLEQVATACGGRVPEPIVVGWMEALLDVLEYLHSRRPPIIFRDLKPDNCMRAASGRVQLVDFGIAKWFCPDSRTSTLIRHLGTPGYAAPEQYGSGPTDARSDVYSLGATAYRLLAGQAPPEPAARAAGVPLPRLRDVDASISPCLDYAVDRMLRLAPAERPTGVAATRLLLRMGREAATGPELPTGRENFRPMAPATVSLSAEPPVSAAEAAWDGGRHLEAAPARPRPRHASRPRTHRTVRTAVISPSWIESRRRTPSPLPSPPPTRPSPLRVVMRSVACLAVGAVLALVVAGAGEDSGLLGRVSRLCYSMAAPISSTATTAPALPSEASAADTSATPAPDAPAPPAADASTTPAPDAPAPPAAEASTTPAADAPAPPAADASATPAADARETPAADPRASKAAPDGTRPTRPADAFRPTAPSLASAASRAHVYAAAGRHALAVPLFRVALRLHPQDADLWDDLGLSLDWLQRSGESLQAYQKAVALEPGNPTFLAHLGSAWARRGDVSRGLVLCRKAAAMAPRDASVLNDLALSWDAAGNSTAAVRTLRAAVLRAPDDPVLWENLGRLYLKLGDASDARRCHSRTLQR